MTIDVFEEICTRRKYSIETRRKLHDWFTIDGIPTLPSENVANLPSIPDCPLCKLMHLAITDGPLDFSTARNRRGPWSAERAGFRVGSVGTFLSFLEDGGTSPWLPKRGRMIENAQINPDLISKWIRSCETVHRSECAPLPLQIGYGSGLKVFRLIDVTKGCVVEISRSDKQYRYFALSYIWGRAEQVRLLTTNRHILMHPGGLQYPTSAKLLPKTIQDAIDLVRTAGEQYLWVDSLCLLQDDPNDMALSIPFMDMIYRGASVTIIAASGRDANSGLPGVQPGSRQAKQDVEEVVPGVKMVVLRELDEYLSASRYATRGWTLVSGL